ncbi:hypothetical protein L3V83_15415 [Thiotrichales bacterium 19X7-9]|nr:hypothetical protein [Thiotrichales bacterium 19X7-9]
MIEFIKLNKFQVAEKQLFSAIEMFFNDKEPVSIHTLSEAAGSVFLDLANYKNLHVFHIRGSKSLFKKHDFGRTYREHLNQMNELRNFFKHANNDAGNTIEFAPSYNAFSIENTILLYLQLHYRAFQKQSNDKIIKSSTCFLTWFKFNLDSAYLDVVLQDNTIFCGRVILEMIEATANIMKRSYDINSEAIDAAIHNKENYKHYINNYCSINID